VTRKLGRNALVLAGYAAVAFTYFGARLASHPGRDLLGHGRDPQIFVWSFAWWLHALETWQNPFYSHAIYAPDGINLVWATTVPGLSLLFTPLTALVGPSASYNVAEMLVPAVSAYTAYLLCRHLTHSLWASLVGGYLFGFSTYMLGQEQGHMHMTAIFLLPLIALAVVRYLRGEIDDRGVAWRLGVLFGLQFWLSTELLLTAALALVAGLVLAYLLVPATRPRLRAGWKPLLAASGIALVVAAPLAWYAVKGFQGSSINEPKNFNGDLLNFLVPNHFVWIGGGHFTYLSSVFAGNDAEQGAYLGIPTLVIIAWFALRARRSPVARYLLAALAVAFVVTLGTGLAIKGRIVAGLPWKYVAKLPLMNNVLPTRISLFVTLVAAVIVALWTAGRHGWARWLLPALAVLAIAPDLGKAYWKVHPQRWAFFTQKQYKVCFPRNENVAIFPFGAWGDSTLWQAESGFYFRMPEGYLAPTPPAKNLASDPLIRLETYTIENPTPAEIIAFAKNKKVDRILSVDIYVHPSGRQMRRFGEVQLLGGVQVSPACGYPSLQKGIHPATQPLGG
jgi:hypothetical protein